jgi:hypothetical protein
MSKYGICSTVVKEEKHLVEALKEMGYVVEVHPNGAPLNSYYSEQERKVANIIVRRAELRGGVRRHRLCPASGRQPRDNRGRTRRALRIRREVAWSCSAAL